MEPKMLRARVVAQLTKVKARLARGVVNLQSLPGYGGLVKL